MGLTKSWRKGDRRVLVHGTPYFGKLFAETMGGDGWSFRYYPDTGAANLARMFLDLGKCDIVYQICGRVTLGKFLGTAKYLGKKRMVVHWIGSDVLEARPAAENGTADPWLIQHASHWAETPWLMREVEALGPECEVMPLPGARLPETHTPLPEKFSVLIYVPGTYFATFYGSEPMRVSDFYGLESMLEVARQLPDIDFQLVGVEPGEMPGLPKNIWVHGRVPDLTEFYQRTTVLWRPVQHDGLSFMVLEALAHGRHVIWIYQFPGCIRASSVSEARDEIAKLKELHQDGALQLNRAGLQVIAENYRPLILRNRILRRLETMLERQA